MEHYIGSWTDPDDEWYLVTDDTILRCMRCRDRQGILVYKLGSKQIAYCFECWLPDWGTPDRKPPLVLLQGLKKVLEENPELGLEI